jgi:hypothetical protein
MQPILRPCSYSPTHPRIHAITYRGSLSTPIRHSLVELDPSGCVYEIEVRSGEMVRGRVHESVEALETAVRQTSRRLWMHTSSIRTDTVAAVDAADAASSTAHLYADFSAAHSAATAHHSTASLSMDPSLITSTATAYHSTALHYGEPRIEGHPDVESTDSDDTDQQIEDLSQQLSELQDFLRALREGRERREYYEEGENEDEMRG